MINPNCYVYAILSVFLFVSLGCSKEKHVFKYVDMFDIDNSFIEFQLSNSIKRDSLVVSKNDTIFSFITEPSSGAYSFSWVIHMSENSAIDDFIDGKRLVKYNYHKCIDFSSDTIYFMVKDWDYNRVYFSTFVKSKDLVTFEYSNTQKSNNVFFEGCDILFEDVYYSDYFYNSNEGAYQNIYDYMPLKHEVQFNLKDVSRVEWIVPCDVQGDISNIFDCLSEYNIVPLYKMSTCQTRFEMTPVVNNNTNRILYLQYREERYTDRFFLVSLCPIKFN